MEKRSLLIPGVSFAGILYSLIAGRNPQSICLWIISSLEICGIMMEFTAEEIQTNQFIRWFETVLSIEVHSKHVRTDLKGLTICIYYCQQ